MKKMAQQVATHTEMGTNFPVTLVAEGGGGYYEVYTLCNGVTRRNTSHRTARAAREDFEQRLQDYAAQEACQA